MFVTLSNRAPGGFFTFIHYQRQTCAHFGSLFIGSDIDGRQMRGRGTFLNVIIWMLSLKLLLHTKLPALGLSDPPINTA
jgi:hypothetical protein